MVSVFMLELLVVFDDRNEFVFVFPVGSIIMRDRIIISILTGPLITIATIGIGIVIMYVYSTRSNLGLVFSYPTGPSDGRVRQT